MPSLLPRNDRRYCFVRSAVVTTVTSMMASVTSMMASVMPPESTAANAAVMVTMSRCCTHVRHTTVMTSVVVSAVMAAPHVAHTTAAHLTHTTVVVVMATGKAVLRYWSRSIACVGLVFGLCGDKAEVSFSLDDRIWKGGSVLWSRNTWLYRLCETSRNGSFLIKVGDESVADLCSTCSLYFPEW